MLSAAASADTGAATTQEYGGGIQQGLRTGGVMRASIVRHIASYLSVCGRRHWRGRRPRSPLIRRAAPPAGDASAARRARAATESVLVVRRAVDHDALWLLSPADGTPTAAGDLPGFAWSAAVSPDGQNVAYLPENERAPRLDRLRPAGAQDHLACRRRGEAHRLVLLDRRRPAAGRRSRRRERAHPRGPAVPGQRRDRQGAVVPRPARRRAELSRRRPQGRLHEVQKKRRRANCGGDLGLELLPGDLPSATDLGTGRLPVWVRP